MRTFATILKLALKDYLHDRLLSSFAVLGLAAVLAPLLILFGVKNGIINTMAERLIDDPHNREITPVGSGRYEGPWFAEMAARPDVVFVIPQTRSIAANMILVYREGATASTLTVDLIPTGTGDPLLEKWGRIPDDDRGVVLSASAAEKLGATEGTPLSGRIGRARAGIKENAAVALKVAAVLPLEAFGRDAAFVRLALLEAAEDYRDGFRAEAFGWPGAVRPAVERTYPSFRLYSRSIYDVAGLRDLLVSQGLEVYTRAEEIGVVRYLDRSFSLIFRLVAAVAVLGYFAAMASNTLANVNRKVRHLGITRLIGFSTRSIIWFPVVQAVTTSLLGTLISVLLYHLVAASINRLFATFMEAGERVCHLALFHQLTALVLTAAMAALASAYAAFRVAKIEPSEVIRDV
jgi:putative ABC transport system permease protein